MGSGAARALPSCGDSIRSAARKPERRGGFRGMALPLGLCAVITLPEVVLITASPEVHSGRCPS
ncbi:MAG: hypothetical protein M1296_07855, partial [Chloroflexi bacterium]|nr:hypothetical protein [Chloroflexota bacterium]